MRRSLDTKTRARIGAKYAIDLAVWTAAVPIAFVLRMSDPWRDGGATASLVFALMGLPLKVLLLWGFRIERRSWRRATVADLVSLATVVAIATVIGFVAGWILYSTLGFPRTVPLIEGVVAFLGMGGVRLVARLASEQRANRRTVGSTGSRRVLLVGAGDAGARMAREMRRHMGSGLTPVGFVDDDPAKLDLRIGGVRVLGGVDDLPVITGAASVDEVLITMPSAPGREVRRVVELARTAEVPCRVLPSVAELLKGEVDIQQIREVRVEDLLRREPVQLDTIGLAAYLEDRVVLVSGAGGSIGSELVRQVAKFGPRRVILVGRGENSLHSIQQELRMDVAELDHVTVVGNVCDREKMSEVFATHAPHVVFHAAAHKHVPLMQYHPDEAILNNVGGTRTLAEVALAAGVSRFVNVSTDKAVQPISMVGYTKRLAEEVVRSVAREAGPDQAFVSVRFGNVLGSRGSVIPLFQEQIRRGGPVTITDPTMTRYFMTIPEASQLVIQAGALATNGAVYVLDMGEPVRILDLAQDLLRLNGTDEDDVEIHITGTRPGEKLHEELFTPEEIDGSTRYDKILMARLDQGPASDLRERVDAVLTAARRREWRQIDRTMKDVLPEYVASNVTQVAVP